MSPLSLTRLSGRLIIAAIALGLVAAGAAGMRIYLGGTSADPSGAHPMPPPAVAAGPMGDVVITLTAEAMKRAGIATTEVRSGRAPSAVRVPGIVEPNAYRQVVVTALAGGQVSAVRAELGQRVREGDVLAEIFSPPLAEAQRSFVAMRGDLEAVELRVTRLERLVEIGAASRQELESAIADRTRMAAEVEGARSRLQLLGVSAAQIGALLRAGQMGATLSVVAPADGVVTERLANRGQNVDASAALFTIVDLTTVWVVGDVYERDLGRIRVGQDATVTTPASPEGVWTGRVSYVDPSIAAMTRTARVRVEVPNPGTRLLLGMYADLAITDEPAARQILVPATALQTVGEVQVVYVADPAMSGRFVERVVTTGVSSGGDVTVTGGVTAGERVVTDGAFSLRAERDRLGLPPPRRNGGEPIARRDVDITAGGFTPATGRERRSLPEAPAGAV
jgi:cobalt-zinc-cadmium efflux system membrane fusion protein